jgi:hypothetical protein
VVVRTHHLEDREGQSSQSVTGRIERRDDAFRYDERGTIIRVTIGMSHAGQYARRSHYYDNPDSMGTETDADTAI